MKLLLILLLAAPVYSQIDVKYDKFKDVSTASFSYRINGEGGPGTVRLAIGYMHKGQKLEGEPRYWMQFASMARLNLYFNRKHSLIFLIDGERHDLGEGRYILDNPPGVGLSERVLFEVEKADLEQIANGKVVSFQIGGFEAEIEEKQKKGIKELLAR